MMPLTSRPCDVGKAVRKTAELLGTSERHALRSSRRSDDRGSAGVAMGRQNGNKFAEFGSSEFRQAAEGMCTLRVSARFVTERGVFREENVGCVCEVAHCVATYCACFRRRHCYFLGERNLARQGPCSHAHSSGVALDSVTRELH